MEMESLRLDDEIGALLTCSSLGILSHEDQPNLNQLRTKTKALFDHYLLTWKLNSRAKWGMHGDSNTKFFHALASGCRNQNAIWALEDEEGHIMEDEVALKELGERHFSHIFSDDKQTCILSQLKVVLLYPSMISSKEANGFIESVSMIEIDGALRSFKKDRIPGPHGWPV